jgi:hypothetical protein
MVKKLAKKKFLKDKKTKESNITTFIIKLYIPYIFLLIIYNCYKVKNHIYNY